MFIKLTNAIEEFEDKPILINTAHIISVIEMSINDVSVTNVYSITKENWNVKESVEQVYKLINKAR